MKSLGKVMFLVIVLTGLLLTAGCGGQKTGEQPSDQNSAAVNQEAALNGLTKSNPFKVDKEAGTVSFLAQVNGKYFYEASRHAAVFAEGSNGEKAVFRGFAKPEDFYNGLLEIGAQAGENMTMDNKETTNVAGDVLDVTVRWQGSAKEYKLSEVINDSNGKPIEMRFGGNLKTNQEKGTGCLICLDSCPVGIASNANYTYGAVEKRTEVKFTGNKDVLPADGTLAVITVKLSK